MEYSNLRTTMLYCHSKIGRVVSGQASKNPGPAPLSFFRSAIPFEHGRPCDVWQCVDIRMTLLADIHVIDLLRMQGFVRVDELFEFFPQRVVFNNTLPFVLVSSVIPLQQII